MAKKNDSIFNFDNLIILFFLIILVCCLFKNRNIKEGVDSGPTCKQQDGSECTAAGYNPTHFDSSDQNFATNAIDDNCPDSCQFSDGSSDDSFFSIFSDFPECADLVTGTIKGVNKIGFDYLYDMITGETFDMAIHCACETDGYFVNPTTRKCEQKFFSNHCETGGAGVDPSIQGDQHLSPTGDCEAVPTPSTPIPGCTAPSGGDLANYLVNPGDIPTGNIFPDSESRFRVLNGVQCKTAQLSSTQANAGGRTDGYCLPKMDARGVDLLGCQSLTDQDDCINLDRSDCSQYENGTCVSVGCTDNNSAPNSISCTPGNPEPPGSGSGPEKACVWIQTAADAATGQVPPLSRTPHAYCPLDAATAGGPYEIMGCPLQSYDKYGGNVVGATDASSAVLIPAPASAAGGGTAGAGTAVTGVASGSACLSSATPASEPEKMCAAGLRCIITNPPPTATDASTGTETPGYFVGANGICQQ
jgi:hypothetical protein